MDKNTPLHPIQLQYLGVRELSIRSYDPPGNTVSARAENASLKVICPDNFDPAVGAFSVSVVLEIGSEQEPEVPTEGTEPYYMRIELRGFFSVDTSKFAAEHVADWAQRGAMFVLYPFLREHAFGLSSRAGFKPLLLPLLQVPTFKTETMKG